MTIQNFCSVAAPSHQMFENGELFFTPCFNARTLLVNRIDCEIQVVRSHWFLIEGGARAEAGVDGLNDCRTMHFGPNEILVAMSVDFRDDLTASDVEDTVARLEHAIRAAYPQAGRIYVEAQSFASHAAVRQAVIAGGGAGALVSDVPVLPRPSGAHRPGQ